MDASQFEQQRAAYLDALNAYNAEAHAFLATLPIIFDPEDGEQGYDLPHADFMNAVREFKTAGANSPLVYYVLHQHFDVLPEGARVALGVVANLLQKQEEEAAAWRQLMGTTGDVDNEEPFTCGLAQGEPK